MPPLGLGVTLLLSAVAVASASPAPAPLRLLPASEFPEARCLDGSQVKEDDNLR